MGSGGASSFGGAGGACLQGKASNTVVCAIFWGKHADRDGGLRRRGAVAGRGEIRGRTSHRPRGDDSPGAMIDSGNV